MTTTIAVTSAVRRTGKTTVLVNLATVLAEHFQQKVLCVQTEEISPFAADSFSEWFGRPAVAPPPSSHPFSRSDLRARIEIISENLHLLRDTQVPGECWRENLQEASRGYTSVLLDTTDATNGHRWLAQTSADVLLLVGGVNLQELDGLRRWLDWHGQEQTNYPIPQQQLRTVLQTRWEVETDEALDEELAAEIRSYPALFPPAYSQEDCPVILVPRIGADDAYRTATAHRRAAPLKSPAREQYIQLAAEILRLFSVGK